MTQITKSRTLTYDGEEVYVRTHVDLIDGLTTANSEKKRFNVS